MTDLSFTSLCNHYGYWPAVRMTLTYIGVDFSTSVEEDSSLAIKAGLHRFVLWHNNQGNNEPDIGIRYMVDSDCDDIILVKGIDNTFSFLGDVLMLVEDDISFASIPEYS